MGSDDVEQMIADSAAQHGIPVDALREEVHRVHAGLLARAKGGPTS